MRSIGSLTHIDVAQRGSTALKYGRGNNIISGISEDYRGQQNISLKVDMNGYTNKQPTNEIDWLPCCGLPGESIYEIQPIESPYSKDYNNESRHRYPYNLES